MPPLQPGDQDDLPGTTIFDDAGDGTVVTRKEAESLTFPKFGEVESFRANWAEMRREIVNRSGRRRLCSLWWARVSDLSISFKQLGKVGRIFEQFDCKILVAVLKLVDGDLKRKFLRIEE